MKNTYESVEDHRICRPTMLIVNSEDPTKKRRVDANKFARSKDVFRFKFKKGQDKVIFTTPSGLQGLQNSSLLFELEFTSQRQDIQRFQTSHVHHVLCVHLQVREAKQWRIGKSKAWERIVQRESSLKVDSNIEQHASQTSSII